MMMRKKKRKQQQQQTKKTRKQQFNNNDDNDVKILQQKVEELFDDIAPHVSLEELNGYIQKLNTTPTLLEKILKQLQHEQQQEETYFPTMMKQKEIPMNWMKARILLFWDILPKKYRKKLRYSPTFLNKKQLTQDVQLLMDARTFSIKTHPLVWTEEPQTTRTRDKSSRDEQYRELSSKLTKLHESKSQKQQEEEATQLLTNILACRLSTVQYKRLLEFIKTYVEQQKQRINPGPKKGMYYDKKQKKYIPLTKNPVYLHMGNIIRKVGSHIHLVGIGLAKFFYMDDPPTTTRNNNNNTQQNNNNDNDSSDSSTVNSSSSGKKKEKNKKTKKAATSWGQILQAKQSWMQAKQEFVKGMMELHPKITNLTKNMQKQHQEQQPYNQQDYNWYRGKHLRFEAILLQEHDETTTTIEPQRRMQLNGDYSTGKVSLSSSSSSSLSNNNNNNNNNNIVFIDNLPTGIRETDIKRYYSKCGPIQKVQIYNRRPDLDPGPLSDAHRKAMVKQTKHSSSSSRNNNNHDRNRQWKRPKSPIYAVIHFKTTDGYKKAMQDYLRIFGMVVNEHALRSISGQDMVTLYIENINQKASIPQIEAKLNEILYPHHLYILNLNQYYHTREKRSYNINGQEYHHQGEPIKSLQIQFPSFEYAQNSFETIHKSLNHLFLLLPQTTSANKKALKNKEGEEDVFYSHNYVLNNNDDDDGSKDHNKEKDEDDDHSNNDTTANTTTTARLNWMPTPDDAMDYWTRRKTPLG